MYIKGLMKKEYKNYILMILLKNLANIAKTVGLLIYVLYVM